MVIAVAAGLAMGAAFGGGALAGEAWAGDAQLVQAGDAPPGRLTSASLRDMPAGFPIEVRTFDDTEINLEILALLSEALEKNGYVVADQAPLELSFDSQILRRDSPDPAPSLGSAGVSTEFETGNTGSESGVDVFVNVWSTTKDSVLGGRQKRESTNKIPRFHINAVLRYRDTGQVVWQADAVFEMRIRDESRIIRSMVGPLAASLGQSVRNEFFEIR